MRATTVPASCAASSTCSCAGFVALISWLTFAYVGHAYAVPSGSMEETIMTGDRVLAEKASAEARSLAVLWPFDDAGLLS